MTLAEAIYQHSLRLPEHAAREALDFIEFLEQRYAAVPSAQAADLQRGPSAVRHWPTWARCVSLGVAGSSLIAAICTTTSAAADMATLLGRP